MRPAYKQPDIEAVVADLHQRMLSEMERTNDPLLKTAREELTTRDTK